MSGDAPVVGADIRFPFGTSTDCAPVPGGARLATAWPPVGPLSTSDEETSAAHSRARKRPPDPRAAGDVGPVAHGVRAAAAHLLPPGDRPDRVLVRVELAQHGALLDAGRLDASARRCHQLRYRRLCPRSLLEAHHASS